MRKSASLKGRAGWRCDFRKNLPEVASLALARAAAAGRRGIAVVPASALRSEPGRGRAVAALATGHRADVLELGPATDTMLAAPTAWVFGSEAHGLPEELLGAADHRVRVPIHGRAESLNLATAAAVCLYASARAHRG